MDQPFLERWLFLGARSKPAIGSVILIGAVAAMVVFLCLPIGWVRWPHGGTMPSHNNSFIFSGRCSLSGGAVVSEANTWNGIRCPDGEILSAIAVHHGMGLVNWAELPSNLSELFLHANTLEDAECLDGPSALDIFSMSHNNIVGGANLSSLPDTVTIIRLMSNKFGSFVDFHRLPRNLASFEMKDNQFASPFEMPSLPSTVCTLDLSQNGLCGSLDVKQLPAPLKRLSVSNNQFSGWILVSDLPKSLSILDLSGNSLCGELDFLNLPPNLTHLDIGNNRFNGPVDLTHLPATLFSLILNDNMFSGTLDLSSLPLHLTYLDVSSNKFTGTLNLAALPDSLLYLAVHHNGFHGALDLTRLPVQAFSLYFDHNQLTSLVIGNTTSFEFLDVQLHHNPWTCSEVPFADWVIEKMAGCLGPINGYYLTANQRLGAKDCLVSQNQEFKACLSPSAGLEIVSVDGRLKWESLPLKNDEAAPFELFLQLDGNLVIYNIEDEPIWTTNTQVMPRMGQHKLELTNEGVLVLSQGDLAVWASNKTSEELTSTMVSSAAACSSAVVN